MACAKVISSIEVLAADDLGRRRIWADEEKVRIVEESLRGHRQGSATARRHGISRSLLTQWRADYRAGRFSLGEATFTAVTLAPSALPTPMCEPRPIGLTAPMAEARIEIELRNGRRMIVPASIDPAVLARLLPAVDAT